MLKQQKRISKIFQLVLNFLFPSMQKNTYIQRGNYLNDFAKILGTGPLRLL